MEEWLTLASVVQVLGLTATFFDDASSLGRFAFLFLLQLFGGFLTQQQLQCSTWAVSAWACLDARRD